MKRASVAELRHHFRRVAAWLAQGEEVEIVRRGKPVARLLPIAETTKATKQGVDFEAQLKAIWGDRVFSDRELGDFIRFDRDGGEG